MGDPEDYSIAREGVWGREGLAAAADSRLADFSWRSFFALGRSWGGLGRPCCFLVSLLGGLGAVLGRLGWSWGGL